MARLDSLCHRLEELEASRAPARNPPWCDLRRKLAHCLASLRDEEWICPEPMTPEKAAVRDAKDARYKEYFEELE